MDEETNYLVMCSPYSPDPEKHHIWIKFYHLEGCSVIRNRKKYNKSYGNISELKVKLSQANIDDAK